MKLIVTIDTEEDNWNRYSATDNPVENIQRIPALQQLFDEFNVLPTYLVTYPVATNPKSVAILKRILENGKCEIGMHCHPWNTPPFNENDVIRNQNTMLCNLPEPLVQEKLYVLNDVICKNFGIMPVSFRAGRWGFGPGVAHSLCQLGYRVDSSVTPFVNWEYCHGPDFSSFGPELFRFGPEGLSNKNKRGPLLQVPATVGFLQANYHFCRYLMKATDNKLSKIFHLRGVLNRIGLLNQVWLSPEMTDDNSMIRLASRMHTKKYLCINMSFHSTTLIEGLNPFVKSIDEKHDFLKKIKKFLTFIRGSGWKSQTLEQFEKTFSF